MRNKYTGCVGFKMIDLFYRIIDRYGKITERDLKENQKRFDEVLGNTMAIDKYIEQIDEWIKY